MVMMMVMVMMTMMMMMMMMIQCDEKGKEGRAQIGFRIAA